MSDERIEKLEASLKTLRKQVSQVDRDRRDDRIRGGFELFACTLAGALFALTATTWRTLGDRNSEQVSTLWGMVPEGWQAVVTMLLVLLLAAGTVGAFIGDAGRNTHLFFVAVAVLAAVAIAFAVGLVEPPGWYDAEDGDAGAGRWLAGLACLVLAVTHGARASEVNH